MAFDIGASVGDLSSWMGGASMPIPTPSVKITDLSPQADGGVRAQRRRFAGSAGHPAYDAVILLVVIAALLAAFHYSVRAHIL